MDIPGKKNTCKKEPGTISSQGLRILTLNIRSIYRHFDDLLIYLTSLEKQKIHPQIIVLTETWITSEQLTYFPIKGYISHISERRDGSRSGGVVVFIDEEIDHIVSECAGNTFQSVLVSIKGTHETNTAKDQIKILGLYRDSRKAQSAFIAELENTYLIHEYEKLLITGDFNVDLLNHENSSSLLNTLMSYGLQSYQHQPSRFGLNKHGQRTTTCIDHVHAKNVTIKSVTVDDAGITDHEPILVTVQLMPYSTEHRKNKSTNNSTYVEHKKFHQLLSNETWEGINFGNVDSAFDSFFSTYNSLKPRSTVHYDSNIKINCFGNNNGNSNSNSNNKRKKRSPWLTNDTLKLILRKKELYKTMYKNKRTIGNSYFEVLKSEFKKISAQVVKQVRREKLQYHKNKLKSCKTSKEYWRELKEICGIPSKNKEHHIQLTHKTGKIITDSKEIAEVLNKHFVTVADQEFKKNPLFQSSRNIKNLSAGEITNLKSFGCLDITTFDIYKAVKKLPNKCSTAEDGITIYELKKYWEILCVPLVMLFNLSLQKGVFPKTLKKAQIVPIPKIQNPHSPENFRPIAILSNISKIFESIIQERMLKFLNKMGFFDSKQFGFLPQKNTSEAIVAHLSEIVNKLENGEIVLGLYMDIAKAFDTVSHEILLEKLLKAGFRGVFWEWLQSYLIDRQQQVKYNGSKSNFMSVQTGVPQGSTLGPLLFLIYVNSLLRLPLGGPVFSFADDTALVYSSETMDTAIGSCEHDLKTKFNDWFLYHKICPNLQKTQIINFRFKNQSLASHPTITWHLPDCEMTNCKCVKLKIVSDVKYLGVVLNSNLNWKAHSIYLAKKLRKLNYLLYRVKKILPTRIKKHVYTAFYEPTLSYGIESWGGAAGYILQPVKILQKYAVRAVAGINSRDHTAPIFRDLELLPFGALYERALATTAHREVLHGKSRMKYRGKQTRSQRIYEFTKPNWKRAKARAQVGYRSSEYAATLPDELHEAMGTPVWPIKIKKYLLSKL